MLRTSSAALAGACLLALACAPAARAQVKISALPAPSSVASGAQVPCSQGGVTYACTAAQIAALAPGVDISGKANKAGDTFSGLVAFSTIKPTMLGYSPWTTQDFNYVPANKAGDTFSGPITVSGGGGAQLGYGVNAGFYADSSNLAVRTQNLAGSTLYLQSYGGASNYATFAGAGAHIYTPLAVDGLSSLGRVAISATGSADGPYTFSIDRTSNFTGGTVGYVNRALSCHTTVQGSPNDYEWCGVFVLDNYATGAGQHVGAYFQGNRRAAGVTPTWGAVSEAKDWSGAANPTTGLIAHEFDVEANGTDANFNRIGLDVFAKTKPGGAAAQVGYGLRFSTAGGASYSNVVALTGDMYAGLLISPTSSTFGINFLGAYSGPVVDFSQLTTSSTNANMRFKAGQSICWEATCNYRSQYVDPAVSGYAGKSVLGLYNGFVESVGLELETGHEGLRVNAVPMVGRDPNSVLYLPGAFSTDAALRLPNGAGGTLYFQTFSGAQNIAAMSGSVLSLYVPTQSLNWGSFTNNDSTGFGLRVLAGGGGNSTIVLQNATGGANLAYVNASAVGDLTLGPTSGVISSGGQQLFFNNGQWYPNTPAVSFFAGSSTVSSSQGRFQRVGGSVNYRFQITFAASGSGAGPIVTLPSTASNTIGAVCVGKVTNTGLGLSGQINPNVGTVGISKYDGSAYSPAGDTVVMSCTYEG